MLCQLLLYNKVNQLYVYIYPHIPSLLSLPPTLPIPSFQVVTKHRADLPVLCSCFPLAIYFTFGSVYVSATLSLRHSLPFPLPVPSSPFSTSTSLCLPCHQVHQYRFLKFHIYALAYGICFSLSDLFQSVWQALGPATSLQITQFCSFLWLSDIPEYTCATSSLSIHLFCQPF